MASKNKKSLNVGDKLNAVINNLSEDKKQELFKVTCFLISRNLIFYKAHY